MQILTKTGTRNINFIPREAISGAKVYKLVIKSEGQNKVILKIKQQLYRIGLLFSV